MTQKQADRVYKKLRHFKDGENTIEETLDDLLKEFSAGDDNNDETPMSKTKKKLLANNVGCCQRMFVQPIGRCFEKTFSGVLYMISAIIIAFIAWKFVIFLAQVTV